MPQALPDYYSANMALLQKHHPEIWEQTTSSEIDPLGIVFPATNGEPCLKVINEQNNREIHLHDINNPGSEGAYFLEKVEESHCGFVGILGMGLGYAPMAILKERPHLQFLAVFELEPGIFLQALRHMDLSTILTDPRLILSIGPEPKLSQVLAPASRTMQLETSNIFYHQPSLHLHTAGYKKIHDDLFSHINPLNIGGSTTKALGKTFLTNRFRHTATIHHHLLLEQLQNVFAGTPAIMVAGGPSLDKNIHLLPQTQERAVIIATDTALPALIKHGIHPHFLTSIDSNNLTYEKFADVAPLSRDISLICSSWVNPKTVNIFPATQTFWTFTQKPIEAWLNTLLGGSLLTAGATTVAHLNLIAAQILGCDPIIFLGQDLAFPAKASHANGTVLQGYSPASGKETLAAGETVRGVDGSILQTNRSFLSMKKHFELSISKSDKTYINATEGGADIKGTQILSLQETLAQYCQTPQNITDKIKEWILNSPPVNPHHLRQEFKKIIAQAKVLRRDIDKADQKSKSVLNRLKKLKQQGVHTYTFDMLPTPLQKTINEIDRLHKKLDTSTMIWPLLEEVSMTGLKESERHKQAIALVANIPEKYIEWLNKNLQRLLAINQTRKETLALLTDNLSKALTFHRQESTYLHAIEAGRDIDSNRLSLARLYMESENYTLAKPLLEELRKTMPQSPEISFYLGCIAGLRTEYDEEARYFNQALNLDPSQASAIDNFHHQLGDEFLGYATYFKTQPGRLPSVKYMVRKGLKYDPHHAQLLKECSEVLRTDLQTATTLLEAGNYPEAALIIRDWHENLLNQEELRSNLPPEEVGQIFRNYGKLLLSDGNQAEAVACFRQAMEYTPGAANLHTLIIDTLFAMGDFNGAIEALNRAIAIDNEFAAYWEIIGDSLQADGQNEDAILAYERCFMSLPQKIDLLKKIGDCYKASDQLEAAQAAYQQLKSKMEELGAANDNIQ